MTDRDSEQFTHMADKASSQNSGGHDYATRFAARLNNALDMMGQPFKSAERAKSLSVNIDCDASTASDVLSGQSMPTYDLLARICDFTAREPGYYLDLRVDQTPPGIKVAGPIETGHPIALLLPSQRFDEEVPPEAKWQYLVAREQMGFGILQGTYIVTYTAEDMPLYHGRIYLFGRDGDYQIRQCFEIGRSSAQFTLSTGVLIGQNRLDLPTKGGKVSAASIFRAGFDFVGIVTQTIRDLRSIRLMPVPSS